mmetsp:Transcript_137479/g.383418  ORF Transcript_137479/g.383418 Transcript_137479/m.383418 type:complete len:386 (-) Transcript_137479:39-1196(-)
MLVDQVVVLQHRLPYVAAAARELIDALISVKAYSLALDDGAAEAILFRGLLHGEDPELHVWREEDLLLALEGTELLDGCGCKLRNVVLEGPLGRAALDLEDEVPKAHRHVLVCCHGGEGWPDKLLFGLEVLHRLFRVGEGDAAPDRANEGLDELVNVVSLEDLTQLLDVGTEVRQLLQVVVAERSVHLVVQGRLLRVEPHDRPLPLHDLPGQWLVMVGLGCHDPVRVRGSLGVQARRPFEYGRLEVWSWPSAHGGHGHVPEDGSARTALSRAPDVALPQAKAVAFEQLLAVHDEAPAIGMALERPEVPATEVPALHLAPRFQVGGPYWVAALPAVHPGDPKSEAAIAFLEQRPHRHPINLVQPWREACHCFLRAMQLCSARCGAD